MDIAHRLLPGLLLIGWLLPACSGPPIIYSFEVDKMSVPWEGGTIMLSWDTDGGDVTILPIGHSGEKKGSIEVQLTAPMELTLVVTGDSTSVTQTLRVELEAGNASGFVVSESGEAHSNAVIEGAVRVLTDELGRFEVPVLGKPFSVSVLGNGTGRFVPSLFASLYALTDLRLYLREVAARPPPNRSAQVVGSVNSFATCGECISYALLGVSGSRYAVPIRADGSFELAAQWSGTESEAAISLAVIQFQLGATGLPKSYSFFGQMSVVVRDQETYSVAIDWAPVEYRTVTLSVAGLHARNLLQIGLGALDGKTDDLLIPLSFRFDSGDDVALPRLDPSASVVVQVSSFDDGQGMSRVSGLRWDGSPILSVSLPPLPAVTGEPFGWRDHESLFCRFECQVLTENLEVYDLDVVGYSYVFDAREMRSKKLLPAGALKINGVLRCVRMDLSNVSSNIVSPLAHPDSFSQIGSVQFAVGN